MKKFFIFITFILLLPPTVFCEEPAETHRKLYSQGTIPEIIRSKLEALAVKPDSKIAGEKIHNIEYISNLYQTNNFQPFWTELSYVEDAMTGIRNSYDDGLTPLDYHMEAVLAITLDLSKDFVINQEKISKAVELELLLTDGVIFYADHLLYGKTDPISLAPTWNFGFAPIPDLNGTTFKQYIINGNVTSWLDALRPDLHLYDTLLVTLSFYREIQAKGGWITVPIGGKIEPGDDDPRIPIVRKRLMKTGNLTQIDSLTNSVYDKTLEGDIRRFQSTHGLDADGIIGAGSFRELNVPVASRIETLRVNMERIRWVSGNLPKDYLIVNISAFWLTLIKEGEPVYKTNVVVGRPLNKTPVFRDQMHYVEFNPTWTVPTSIIRKEIIPKIKSDPEYLTKNHMVLLDSQGNIVPDSILDFQNLSAARFPYIVRQEPGPWNALGVVKFMFPNEYDIYLHDTPSKSLFNNARRAYSHGCIRVNEPLDLTEVLLQNTEWNRQKMNEVIETRQTTRVNLTQPIDVLLSYWTCGLNPDQEIFFTDDIYDKDDAVLKELNRILR